LLCWQNPTVQRRSLWGQVAKRNIVPDRVRWSEWDWGKRRTWTRTKYKYNRSIMIQVNFAASHERFFDNNIMLLRLSSVHFSECQHRQTRRYSEDPMADTMGYFLRAVFSEPSQNWICTAARGFVLVTSILTC